MAKMTVITERCKGCGLCAGACPKKIVELQKAKRNKKVISTQYAPTRTPA